MMKQLAVLMSKKFVRYLDWGLARFLLILLTRVPALVCQVFWRDRAGIFILNDD